MGSNKFPVVASIIVEFNSVMQDCNYVCMSGIIITTIKYGKKYNIAPNFKQAV